MATVATASQSLAAKTRNNIVGLFIMGSLLMAAGVVVAASQQPSTEVVDVLGTTQTTGSDGGYGAGLALAGVGSLLVFVAVIAWGVILGLRAAPRD